MKSAYHQIRLVEGLELEEILCFHVRNVLVDILRGGGLRREKSHSTTRTHLSLHETHKTLDTSKSSLHSGRYTSSFARFLSGYVESNCWDDGGVGIWDYRVDTTKQHAGTYNYTLFALSAMSSRTLTDYR